ncbi:TNF receptor-associated factor 2-like [Pristis pectinata]|uniref:TNF receptor-associated factor 2-like n=1 Tax=Pristis pectinata TaxID=685728 RepID=UPI00223DD20C|nr:TNF receptor-associated factor 2-like [Pristis pectinata]XP_051899807.1 TNF receptor-associated factor 2-like [Pristis pectinata]XP_051899808.1 TNF receptor-associated factor 2-like [Pristis pectinata]XP_051899809.1 TNF receptor-associated factor 2-like [Pristis pectinata]
MSLLPLKHGDEPHLYSSVCVEKMAPFSSTVAEETDGGYVTNTDWDYNRKYYCGACGLLMRDPVQTECGHRFCETCHKKVLKELMMCPSCLRDKEIYERVSVATFEKCFKDRAIAKEILNLEVSCLNQGCTWTGPLREREAEHKMNCEQNLRRCPFSVVGCEEMISNHKIEEHIQTSIQHHLNCILRSLQQFRKVPYECPSLEGITGNRKEMDTEPNQWLKEKSQGENAQEELKVKLQTFENIVTVLNREVGHTISTVVEQEKWIKEQDAVIAQLKSKIRQNEKSICLKDVVIADLQFRLEVLENTSYDGTFVWGISDLSRKMQDAIDGRTPSILSPPFFTSHCGYKLCLRMYLNGDGVGANTHLSLFLVIMKGKYDPILEWPFSKKVTFKLLAQQDRNHQVVSAFKPDIGSASFRRPTHTMNVASGCPQFLPLTHLRSNWRAYVADDTMFVKAIVET